MISGEVRSGTGNVEVMLETGEAGETTSACRSWAERRHRRAELGAGDAKAETNQSLGAAVMGNYHHTPQALWAQRPQGGDSGFAVAL